MTVDPERDLPNISPEDTPIIWRDIAWLLGAIVIGFVLLDYLLGVD